MQIVKIVLDNLGNNKYYPSYLPDDRFECSKGAREYINDRGGEKVGEHAARG